MKLTGVGIEAAGGERGRNLRLALVTAKLISDGKKLKKKKENPS